MPAESAPPPTPSLTAVSVADDSEVEPLLRRAAADLSALTVRLGAATHRADEADRLAEVAVPPDDSMLDDEANELRRQLDQERDEQQRLLDAELLAARAEAADAIATARAAAFETVRAASLELDAAVAALGGSLAPSPMEGEAEVVPPDEVAADEGVVAPVEVDGVTPVDVVLTPVEVEPPVEVEHGPPVEVEVPVDGTEARVEVVLTPVEVESPVEVEVEVPVEVGMALAVMPPEVADSPKPSFLERLLHPEAVMLVEIAFVVILILWLR